MQHATSPEGENSCDQPPPSSTLTVEQNPSTGVLSSVAARLPEVADWSDWRWQVRNRVRRVTQLKTLFPDLDIAGVAEATARFPMAITPYYASLIQRCDNTDPIFRMSVPQMEELIEPVCLSDDPLEEDADMPIPGLVHRYTDRALLIATTMCSMYCRHCTRKRVAGHRESGITPARLKQVTRYLTEHPEIHDVIVSGGDPFTLPTQALESILSAIRSVPTVDIIRVGTRTPVVMPMRITDELVTMLRRYHPVYVNTHFNHPAELTPAAVEACTRLADAGIPMGNQTVLLKGVNDDPVVMETLCRGLVRMRVRPYYMFQCDLVRGVEHFRTPLTRGIEIMEYLRGRLSGLAIPSFVVDAPHGGGKIPVSPNYIVSMSPTHTVLRNFEGMLVAYPEPGLHGRGGTVGRQASDESAPGVWELSSGNYSKIQPQNTVRHARRQRGIPEQRQGELTL